MPPLRNSSLNALWPLPDKPLETGNDFSPLGVLLLKERSRGKCRCQPAPLPPMKLEMLLPAAPRVAQCSSCCTEKTVSFCRRQKGCTALLPHALTGASRVSKQSLRREVSIGSSLFLMFTWVGFRQPGRSLTAEPMGPKDSKAFFSRILRKPWQPSSLLCHCCQVHCWMSDLHPIKTRLQEQKLAHNHLASCLESCSDAGSSPSGISLRFFSVLYSTLPLLQKPLWTALFSFLSCQYSHEEP